MANNAKNKAWLPPLPSIGFYPAIDNQDDLNLCKKYVHFNLQPLLQSTEVFISTTRNLTVDNKTKDVRYLSEAELKLAVKTAQSILIWKMDAFWDAPAYIRRKAVICDPYTSFSATDTLNAWVSEKCNDTQPKTNNLPPPILTLKKSADLNKRDVLIIGSAPNQKALNKLNKKSAGDPICLYMGSTVQDTDLTRRFPPDLIVAADGPSQFSDFAIAKSFRANVEAHLRTSQAYLIIPSTMTAISHNVFSKDILDKIITIPAVPSPNIARLDFEKNQTIWHTHQTGNILTTMALPIASKISMFIRLCGVTLPHEIGDGGSVHWNHIHDAKYAKRAAEILSREPGSILPVENYREKHMSNLGTMLNQLLYGRWAVKDHADNLITTTLNTVKQPHTAAPIWLRASTNILSKLQHAPLKFFLVLYILIMVTSGLLAMQINIEITILIITCLCLTLIILGGLLLRLRMNRAIAAAERRLSRQQALQFKNLSDRLSVFEDNNA